MKILENLSRLEHRTTVINSIHQERTRQEQLHPFPLDLDHLYIALSEEFGEVAQALQSYLGMPGTKHTDANDLYRELVQVAAVATRMAEQVIRDENSRN